MDKKVLVTGGAGFIGSELTRQLCDRGAMVIVVDNLLNGRRENLAGLPEDQVRLVVADIRDSQRMAELMQGVDIVYHLACLCLRHSLHSPEENHTVNATGTLKLLSVAMEAGVKRFVYTSTGEVYGTPRWSPVTEEHPNSPTNVYGAAKLAGEAYTLAFYQTYHYPTVVVRLFNTYGPRCHHEGDCGEVIPRFLLRCLAGRPMVIFGDGSQTRDFNFVGDTARGVLLAGLADEAVGQAINLGTGRPTSIKELADQVAAVVGRPDAEVIYDAPRPGDVLGLFYADNTKARQLLGYEPEISLSEGLTRLKDWYLSLGQPPEALLEQEILHNWDAREVKAHA
ncbi:MAG: SDR family NAD(P)-dependent oxidoreductase [Anaerolineae bacterium]